MLRATAWVEADAWADGEDGFRIREDLAPTLLRVRDQVRARGGILTSDGGLRLLDAPVTSARSAVSLHYLGRAIDLCVTSAMQTLQDPYAIGADGTEDGRPLWRVFAVAPRAAGGSSTVETRFWRDGGDVTIVPRMVDPSDVDHAGGDVIIATLPELADVVARSPGLHLVTYGKHINNDAFVSPELRAYIMREMERVDEEADARIIVYRSRQQELRAQ